jgi:hypothetical protein
MGRLACQKNAPISVRKYFRDNLQELIGGDPGHSISVPLRQDAAQPLSYAFWIAEMARIVAQTQLDIGTDPIPEWHDQDIALLDRRMLVKVESLRRQRLRWIILDIDDYERILYSGSFQLHA